MHLKKNVLKNLKAINVMEYYQQIKIYVPLYVSLENKLSINNVLNALMKHLILHIISSHVSVNKNVFMIQSSKYVLLQNMIVLKKDLNIHTKSIITFVNQVVLKGKCNHKIKILQFQDVSIIANLRSFYQMKVNLSIV